MKKRRKEIGITKEEITMQEITKDREVWKKRINAFKQDLLKNNENNSEVFNKLMIEIRRTLTEHNNPLLYLFLKKL